MSFHVFSIVFRLISNLGGVTDAEKAPCSLEKILDKLRVPAAIFLRRLAKYELLLKCYTQAV